jgi:hypothetical protein
MKYRVYNEQLYQFEFISKIENPDSD